MREDNPLQPHEFYGKYANMPVADRDKEVIEHSEGGLVSANWSYQEVSRLDDEIRKATERRDMIIADASKYIREHQA